MVVEVQINDRIEDATGKVVLQGFPDVGLVGSITVSYLVDQLQLKEVGYVDSEALPPIATIRNSEVKELLRIYEGRSAIVFLSEIPVPANMIKPLAAAMIRWARGKGVSRIYCLTGLAEPNRLEIETPKIYVSGSSAKLVEEMADRLEAEVLQEGFVAGINAELMKQGVRNRYDVGVLLVQSHYNYPDPGAAAQLLLKMPRLIGEEVDVNPLLQSAEMVRMQLRDLMRRTSDTMGVMQKSKELELPPVYR
ncbi:MAG: PAC2 family protein [Nitrososphaerota archaeon]